MTKKNRGMKFVEDITQGKRSTEPEFRSVDEKFRTAVGRGIEILARVSYVELETDSRGSWKVQVRKTKKWLKERGVDPSLARVTQIVERSTEEASRDKYEEVVDRIRAGQTGVLIVSYGSRLGRNMRDGTALADLVRDQGVLVVIGGQILDPKTPHGRRQLLDQILESEVENSLRGLQSASASEELANDLELLIPLPVGLVWASPEDLTFRRAAQEAGLEWCLENEHLQHDKTKVVKNGRRLYVLPNPHPDAYSSLKLVMTWFLATEDPAEVTRRIAASPEYPRPGYVPGGKTHIFNPGVPPKWRRSNRAWLYNWIQRPALYGYYARRSVAPMKYGRPNETQVVVESAFKTGFAPPAALKVVREVFANPQRKWKRHEKTVARNQALYAPRCGVLSGDGQPCSNRLAPCYMAELDGIVYSGSHCGEAHGTPSEFRAEAVDAVVLAVLRRVFRKGSLDGASQELQGTLGDLTRGLENARRAIDRLGDLGRSADDLAIHAGVEQDLEGQRRYRWRARKLYEEQRAAEREVERLELEHASIAKTEPAQIRKKLKLAGSIPDLIARCRQAEEEGVEEGLTRRLVRILVNRVLLRNLGHGFCEVKIEFPTGYTIRGYYATRPFRMYEGEIMYAQRHLQEGYAPARIADLLNERREAFSFNRCSTGRWRTDDVLAADLAHPEGVSTALAPGVSPDVVAARALEPVVAVEGAALANKLGPLYWEGARFTCYPRPDQVDNAFRDSIPDRYAAALGVEPQDFVPLREWARKVGKSLHGVEQPALTRNALLYAGGSRFVIAPIMESEDHGIALRSPWIPVPDRLADPEIGRLLAEAVPEGADLTAGKWLNYGELRQRCHISLSRFYSGGVFAKCKPQPEKRAVYFWWDRPTMLSLMAPLLHEAVAALPGEFSASDFYIFAELKKHVRQQIGLRLNRLELIKKVLSVRVSETGWVAADRYYFYVPPEIWSTNDPNALRTWLGLVNS